MRTESSNPQPMIVLVTGISGFLAGHIALQLLQQGYRVRGSLRSGRCADEVAARLAAAGGDTTRLAFVEADLMRDDGWAAAVAGCAYVIHTASPFPAALPKTEDELIRPAREGAVRVLKAAHLAGVRRVVLTSSIAATNYGHGTAPYTEEDWTDVTSLEATPYYKSKTLAEQDAWAFARENGLELAVINPGLILGPLLGPDFGTSVEVIRKLLSGEFLALPQFGMSIVDVRDVADAHLRAMITPQAAGQRFIASGRFMWLGEVATILREAYPAYAAKLPRRVLPNWLVRILAYFDPTVRLIVAELGKNKHVSNEKAKRILGWVPRKDEEAIFASAQSLIERGVVKAVK